MGPSGARKIAIEILRALLGRFLDPSWAPKGGQDGAQDETLRPQDDPRGRQDGTQDDKNRSENRLQKRSRLRTVLRPLGAILGRSWRHLEVDFGHFLLENIGPRENQRFRKKVVSRHVLGRSWVDLGGPRGRLGRPWEVKLGVRRSQDLVLGGLKALRS